MTFSSSDGNFCVSGKIIDALVNERKKSHIPKPQNGTNC